MVLPRLYVIVDRGTLEARGVGVRAFAEELRDGGVRLVQYRDKVGGAQAVLRGAREIAEVFQGVGSTLILNDRADLAALLGWGVHVGQGDLSVEDVRRLLGVLQGLKPDDSPVAGNAKAEALAYPEDRVMVGVSTHDETQVLRLHPSGQRTSAGDPAHAQDDKSIGPDYVAVGPVFGTVTKRDAEAVVGLEGVRAARALTERPLVAIGGITLENCRSVVEAGADSVAVISGMFVAGRTVRAVAEDFLERMR